MGVGNSGVGCGERVAERRGAETAVLAAPMDTSTVGSRAGSLGRGVAGAQATHPGASARWPAG
eukprot:1670451-Lingulodinium_polyedra.AAC.1